MLLLLLMQANDHQGLKAYRKQHMALYQRRLRKGVFSSGGATDVGEDNVSEEEVSAALAGLSVGNGAAVISNELLSMEDEEKVEEDVQEESKHGGADDDDDDPDSSRKSTTRSFGLKLSFPSARKKKGKQEEHSDNHDPDG
jgi:TATA-binding protein-associated factor Taf7